MKSYKLILTLSLSMGILAGCCHNLNKRGEVYRDWSRNFSELGIFPVFPPREDVYVGDIYLLPAHPFQSDLIEATGGLGMSGVHMSYNTKGLGLNNANLTQYYQLRPQFPLTSSTNGTGAEKLDFAMVPRIINTSVVPQTVFEPQLPLSLRQVAFPEFSFTSIHQGNLGAMVPIEGIALNLGFDISKVAQVDVKIPRAESYGLTSEILLTDLFRDTLRTNLDASDRSLYLLAEGPNCPVSAPAAQMARAMFNQTLGKALESRRDTHCISEAKYRKLVDHINSESNYLYLAMISEVFYARSIDIQITMKTAWTAGAAAKPLGIEELQKLKNIATTSQTTSSTTVSNNGPVIQTNSTRLEAGDDPFALARKYREMQLGSSSIGGSVRVVGVSAKSIGLQRTFEQPIAVGVRGMLIRIEKDAKSVPCERVSSPDGSSVTNINRLVFPINLSAANFSGK